MSYWKIDVADGIKEFSIHIEAPNYSKDDIKKIFLEVYPELEITDYTKLVRLPDHLMDNV